MNEATVTSENGTHCGVWTHTQSDLVELELEDNAPNHPRIMIAYLTPAQAEELGNRLLRAAKGDDQPQEAHHD